MYPSPANSGAERHITPGAPPPGADAPGVTRSMTRTAPIHRDSSVYSTIGSTGASRPPAPNRLPRRRISSSTMNGWAKMVLQVGSGRMSATVARRAGPWTWAAAAVGEGLDRT